MVPPLPPDTRPLPAHEQIRQESGDRPPPPRLEGVNDALLVNVIGLDANTSTRLRAELRGKNIQVLVVKNSLAARAVEARRWPAMFEA